MELILVCFALLLADFRFESRFARTMTILRIWMVIFKLFGFLLVTQMFVTAITE